MIAPMERHAGNADYGSFISCPLYIIIVYFRYVILPWLVRIDRPKPNPETSDARMGAIPARPSEQILIRLVFCFLKPVSVSVLDLSFVHFL
jgi:hypothetical protein